MDRLLAKLYSQSQRWHFLYPLYLALRIPLVFPALARNEGFGGAVKWLYCRLKFIVRKEAIETFHSRHGFLLMYPMDYIIYDEIFLEGCYEFASLREKVGSQPADSIALDFGTHHGMFINFLQTLRPEIEVFGAELSPQTFQKASKRFAEKKNVTLVNVGIGGFARKVSITINPVSTVQSIYSGEGDQKVEASIVTAADFVAMNKIDQRKIAVLKMDIEGAEKEVFEKFDAIKSVLAATSLFIIEIHREDYVAAINARLESVGFHFQENKGINYFYSK